MTDRYLFNIYKAENGRQDVPYPFTQLPVSLSSCLWYLDDAWAGLWLFVRVFQDSDWTVADDTSSQEHLKHTGERSQSELFTCWVTRQVKRSDLADQSGIPAVSDVILSDVTVEPITEVEVTVVQRDQDVRDQP